MPAPAVASLRPHTILAVDDNADVTATLSRFLGELPEFEWLGALSSTEGLVATVERLRPDLVLLDLELRGPDPFFVIEALLERAPAVRVVIFSGHVRLALVDRALGAGAWGYVSKHDGEQELLRVLRRVAAGGFALSREVGSMHV